MLSMDLGCWEAVGVWRFHIESAVARKLVNGRRPGRNQKPTRNRKRPRSPTPPARRTLVSDSPIRELEEYLNLPDLKAGSNHPPRGPGERTSFHLVGLSLLV